MAVAVGLDEVEEANAVPDDESNAGEDGDQDEFVHGRQSAPLDVLPTPAVRTSSHE